MNPLNRGSTVYTFFNAPRISIRGCVRPSVVLSVRLSVRPSVRPLVRWSICRPVHPLVMLFLKTKKIYVFQQMQTGIGQSICHNFVKLANDCNI